jgi:hypothetical protein
MAFLSRDAILAVDDRPTETVTVAEWGGDVLVRGMDGAGRDAYFAAMTVQRGKHVTQDVANATARLVARCVVDPQDPGRLMFSEAEAEILGHKSAAALDKVGNVAARLSGLTEEEMDELKKDSASTQNGGSGSDSPLILERPASGTARKRSARTSSPSGPSTTP